MHNRIGIYPGTFNPIHVGHISFALEAIKICSLDKIIFLPERAPRDKKDAADFRARVNFAKKSIATYPRLEVFILKSMARTLETERRELAEIFDNNRVILLTGTDALRTLGKWSDINLLLKDNEICVGIRDNETVDSVKDTISQIELELETKFKYYIVSTPHKDVSSTKIRSEPHYIPL